MSIPLYSRVVKAKRPIEPTGNGAKVAYSYRRFSSRQQGTGTSLERQLKMAREACITHGWRLVDLPPDRGISAFRITDLDGQQAANFHKGALGAFLAKVEAKEVKVPSVLCLERLDRFSRNYFDIVFPVWLKLLQSGMEIYSCVSGVHYTLDAIRKTPMLAGMALMELANANEYSAGMSKRIGEAFSIRIAEAAKGQKVNLGSWQPRWVDFVGSKGQPGAFKLNGHAATMQRIVREYLDGRSMYQIAKGLIRDKMPCLQNGKWSQGTIANLLRHDSLTGNKTLKRVKLVHYYPRLISDREWERLKAKLADNSAKRGGNPTGDYIANLFRNRCKCSKCGGTMSTEHGYYRCKNRRVGTCDAKYSVLVEDLECHFFLGVLGQHPELLMGKYRQKHNKEMASLKARMADLDANIQDATNLLGKLPITQLEAKLTALVQEREALAKRLDAISGQMVSSGNAPAAIQDIKALWKQYGKGGVPVETVAKRLNALNVEMVSTAGNGLPALRDIKGVWEQYRKGTVPGRVFDIAVDQTIHALKQNEVRKRLLDMLPALVSRVEIDSEQTWYRIVNTAGEVSEWFDIAY
jgi:DNA invertase Pin-like site-specific DNA recombinase